MKSEWGKQVRALVTYLVPSRPDDSPPSVVRRHHKHENADEHSASSMCPYILPALCPPNMFRNTWTCRTRHSSIDMFLSTRSCCSEGWGMRGALVHLHPTPASSLKQRPRHSERCTPRRRQDREHLTFSCSRAFCPVYVFPDSDLILIRKSPSRSVSDSTRLRCKHARTRMISWSSTSNREDSWCVVGWCFYSESQGLILHICMPDLMSEGRIK